MSTQDRFKKRYKTGDTPWDLGKPDFNLIEVVTTRFIQPCKALDIGCGTGDNAIWLAKHNFDVTGSDLSEIAIEQAEQKSTIAGVKCRWLAADFLKKQIPGIPFGFVFDRGCFHSYKTDNERKRFAQKVSAHLAKDGLWLSIVGSADDPPRDHGPPQLTAREIVISVEPYFEILSLTSGHFGSKSDKPPKAWICLMKKRKKEKAE